MINHVRIGGIVDNCIERIKEGRPIEEVVDYAIQCMTVEEEQDVLDTIGNVDLSEPKPDASRGWSYLRPQLAYNALHAAVSRKAQKEASS